MAGTEPLTGVTVQDQSDAATGGTQIGNLAKSLARFTVPRFTSTGARDTAYAAMVSAGGTMADGMLCMVNGVPYRRIAGTWRIDRARTFVRSTAPGTTIAGGGANQTGVTSGIPALASFTLYEACTVLVTATSRAGGTGAALSSVLIDNAQVGDLAVSRSDDTAPIVGTVALAAGSHTIALRCDAFPGNSITWTNARVTVAEHIAE